MEVIAATEAVHPSVTVPQSPSLQPCTVPLVDGDEKRMSSDDRMDCLGIQLDHLTPEEGNGVLGAFAVLRLASLS